MKKTEKKILKGHKTLKQLIQKHSLLDTLHLIWTISKIYTFDKKIDKLEYGQKSLHEYELEFLLKEAILYSNNDNNNPWDKKSIIEYTNYLRLQFDNIVSNSFLEENDIFFEFNRITHRQIKWQKGYNTISLMRYYIIFSDSLVDEVVFDKFKLTTKEIIMLGVYFFGLTGNQFRTTFPIPSSSNVFTQEKVDTFLSHFTTTYNEYKENLLEKREINENMFYTQNLMFDKPLLIYDNSLICPLHHPLFKQITSGIYYSIVNEDKFEKDNRFGKSFEKYIGQVITRTIRKKRFTIFPEFEYFVGKNRKDSSDWIVRDKVGFMFIECKTKRMLFSSISNLKIDKGLEKDLKKLAEFISQPYKVYSDYLNKNIQSLGKIENQIFIPVVLTLEDWFININPGLSKRLDEIVIDEFNRLKLPIELLTNHPYLLMSADEFEFEIQIINHLGFATYLKKKKEQKIDDFKNKFLAKDIFKEEYDELFTSYLNLLKNN